MGYPTTGLQGTVVSHGSANFYSVLLSRATNASASIRIASDEHDVSGLDVEHMVMLPGLRSWTATIQGKMFATPKMGNVGLVAFSAGGYTSHVLGYSLRIRTLYTHDITRLVGPSSAPTWRDFRPDGHTWEVDVDCLADSSTSPVLTSLPTDTLPTVTLTYGDESTDDTFAGTAMIAGLDASVSRGEPNTFKYALKGASALTPAGTTSPFGSSAFNTPLWSEGGSAVGQLVVATLTGSKTFTGADSFWTQLDLQCRVGEPVSYSMTLQGVGAVTLA